MRLIKNIAFFGYSDTRPGEKLYNEAFSLAKILAQKGFVIVNGGGPGVMDASTKGASEAGGETLAVTFYPKNAPGFEGRYVGNVTTEEIKTGNYIERMFKLLEHGDIYIIFNGGTGTLSEFATAWCLARLYLGHHKPFILYGEFWQKIVGCISQNMILRGNELKIFKIAKTADEVLQAIGGFEEEFKERLGQISFSGTLPEEKKGTGL
jgi:uncharacterized protein (TIGR00730 family)